MHDFFIIINYVNVFPDRFNAIMVSFEFGVGAAHFQANLANSQVQIYQTLA